MPRGHITSNVCTREAVLCGLVNLREDLNVDMALITLDITVAFLMGLQLLGLSFEVDTGSYRSV